VNIEGSKSPNEGQRIMQNYGGLQKFKLSSYNYIILEGNYKKAMTIVFDKIWE